MKSLTEEASVAAMDTLTSLRGKVVHWAYCTSCTIEDRVITANEFALQREVGKWVIVSIGRVETAAGNDYYKFTASVRSEVPGIAMDGDVMEEPFVQVRLCQPKETVVAVYFNRVDEQRFEEGLVYENCLVLETSLGRTFKFAPEETIAERIRLILP